MNSKFIFFVTYVILGCSPVILSSTPFYGLSEEVTVGLSQLRDNQEVSTQARYAAHVPLYDMLMKLVVQFLYNLEPKYPADNSTAMVAEITLSDKIAIDYILDAIPFSLGKHCESIEITRRTVHAYVDEIYSTIAVAVDLTISEVYPVSQAKIEVSKPGLQVILEGLIKEIYNLIRICLNTTDPDTLAAIQTSENRSTTHLINAGAPIYNALKLISVATTNEIRNSSLISDVEEYQVKTLTALREEINYECALLEALYINSYLNRTGVVSGMAMNQYVSLVRCNDFREVFETIFGEILRQVNRIRLGIDNDGELVFSRTDNAEAKVTAVWVHGIDMTLDATLTRYPQDSETVTKLRKTLHDLVTETVAIFFRMITVALDQSKTFSEIRAEIRSLGDELARIVKKVMDIFKALIHHNNVLSDEIESHLAPITKAALDAAVMSIRSVEDGLEIVAKAIQVNGAISSDDISAIGATKENAISAGCNYVDYLSKASLILILNQ